ncbi:MAG: dihydroneopterin aldolase [Candidatus Dormibacteraeota bacterium]|nr:dihydroneopterin aldolase [Candidatus Dormibacteraeota bacterium]
MDRLLLEGMVFFGRHGHLAAERELGQHFQVDAELELDLAAAGASDRLADTLDYTRAREAVREVLEGAPHDLLEAVAGRAAAALLDLDARVVGVTVRVRKRPPLEGQFRAFGVEVRRRR